MVQDARVVEAVPKYSVEHVVDGTKESVQIVVALPGVTDSGEIQCIIQEFLCKIHVPGRYRVDIALNIPVEATAEVVRFVKKKAVLKCVLRVKEEYVQWKRKQQDPYHNQPGSQASSSDDEMPALVSDEGVPVPLPGQAAAAPPVTPSCANGQAQRPAARAPAPTQQHQPFPSKQQPSPSKKPQGDIYEQAKQQANRDAAEECDRLARKAEQQGDLQRTVRLLQKACQLVPGEKYERALAEANRKVAASGSGASSSDSRGSSSAAPVGAAASGAAGAGGGMPGAAQQAEQQQSQQQDAYTSGQGFAEAPEQVQQGRRSMMLGGTVSLLLGLTLMGTAVYCVYSMAMQQPVADTPLVEVAPPAAAAAATFSVIGAARSARMAAAPSGPSHASVLDAEAGSMMRGHGNLGGAAERASADAGAAAEGPEAEGEHLSTSSTSSVDGSAKDPGVPANRGAGLEEPGGAWARLSSRAKGTLLRLRGTAAAWLLPPWRAAKWVVWLVLWLPNALIWTPTFEFTLSWAVGVGGLYLVVPAISHMAGRSRKAHKAWGNVCMILAWQPLAWLSFGGGWVSLLGTVGQFLGPFTAWMEGDRFSFLVLSPMLFFLSGHVIRWAAPYTLSPFYYLLWSPRWWTHIPLAVLGFVSAMVMGESTEAQLALVASFFLTVWWVASGGWWAIGSTLCLLTYPLSEAMKSKGMGSRNFHCVMRVLTYMPFCGFLARLVWNWSHSLWLSAPLAITLLGLVAIWQAEYGGGGGARFTSGGSRFNFFGGGAGRRRGSRAGGSPAHLNHDVPAGAPDSVVGVLRCGNYYEVLSLDRDADEATIRRARRTLSLTTHPDKIGDLPGVNEAFNLVTEAAETLLDPSRRTMYDAELTRLEFDARLGSEAAGGGIFGGMRQQRATNADEGEEEGIIELRQHCTHCGGEHSMRSSPSKTTDAARFCGECDTHHPVRDGEVWIERTSAGWFSYELKMYCSSFGLVWDISEMAVCEGLMRAAHVRGFPFNAHVNPIRMAATPGGRASGSGGRRERQPPPPQPSGSRRSSKKKGRRR